MNILLGFHLYASVNFLIVKYCQIINKRIPGLGFACRYFCTKWMINSCDKLLFINLWLILPG